MAIKYLIPLILIFLALPLTSATITQSLNKATYFGGETATLTWSCSGADTTPAKGIQIRWYNSTGSLMQTNLGTCSASNQFTTYAIPLNSNWTNANVTSNTTTGSITTTFFNVSAINTNGLIIGDFTFTSEKYLGKTIGLAFSVKSNTNLKLTNPYCRVRVTSGSTNPIAVYEAKVIDGVGAVDINLASQNYEEGDSYVASIRCECPASNSSQNYCFDENSANVYASYGSAQAPFTVGTWLSINSLVDATNYRQKEELFSCVNITNLYSESYPLKLKIAYNVKCSSGMDNANDLDRVVIMSSTDNPEVRGIDFNETRTFCHRFVVPEPRFMQGNSNQCHASAYVDVLYEGTSIVKGYVADSPKFNITLSDGLQIQPDWQRLENYKWNTEVNLSDSSYNDYNGTGVANIDLRLDKVITDLNAENQQEHNPIKFDLMTATKYIKNWTTSFCNGTTVNSGLEINDDGNLEIELRSVPISPSGTNCYNITLNLNSFEERQSSSLEGINQSQANQTSSLSRSAKALEGIENKTGTFHLSVDCPATGVAGNNIDCLISAKLEDSQEVQKEVDFTCYILYNNTKYAAINFNQMITRTLYTTTKSFLIPSNLEGVSAVLQCEAAYYNLGSRKDMFYDTFSVGSPSPPAGGGGAPSQNNNVIQNIGEKIKEITSPVVAKSLLLLLLGLGLISYGSYKIYVGFKNKMKKKKEQPRRYYSWQEM